MKDLTWVKDHLIAHRGLHSKDKSIPENSMKAFKLAVEKGYGIEFDVNLLKDGTCVVFHDSNLKRMVKGRNEELCNLTYDEVKKIKLLDTDETIHSLKEVLDMVDGRVPLMIELKSVGDANEFCEKFWETIKDYKGIYAIQAFNPVCVGWFKKNKPEVVRGQITEFFRNYDGLSWFKKYLMKIMFFNRFNKPDFVNYGLVDLPNKYVTRARKKGLTVICYTSRSQEDFDRAKKLCDNSVFEFFIPKQ